MGYTLEAINRECEDMSIGAFSWPLILTKTGMGYIIGYGDARCPSQHVYQPRGKGGSPVSNDGYKVTASEAKMMAKICRGYISVKEFINNDWAQLNWEEKNNATQYKFEGKSIYQPETNIEFISLIKKFADFAEKSKGFRIK